MLTLDYEIEVTRIEGSSLGSWAAYATTPHPTRKFIPDLVAGGYGNSEEEALADLEAKLPEAEKKLLAKWEAEKEKRTFTLKPGEKLGGEKVSSPKVSIRARLSSLAEGN